MASESYDKAGSSRRAKWLRWLTFLAMPCLCGALVFADEPPKDAAVETKQPAVKKATAKKKEADKGSEKKDEKKEKKKVDAPSGYEDAPEADDAPPLRAAPVAGNAVAVEAMDAADVDVDFDQILEANVDANVANIERQFMPQFTPLMTAELSFINRACDLNLEQRKKIKSVSDRCLKAACRKYAMTQNGMMRGGFAPARQPTIPDPTDLVHRSLARILSETLQPEQKSAYDDEMEKRRAQRKQVSVENLVAIIDERLVLSADQRKQLLESLNKNWQPSWVQSMQMLMNNNQYLPSIPDRFVVSALNDAQKKVWRTIPKTSYMVWGGFGMGQQAGAVDDFPLVEAVAEVDAAAN